MRKRMTSSPANFQWSYARTFLATADAGSFSAAARVSLVATGRSQAIEGVVRIAASEAVAAFLLAPALRRLRREQPGIHLEIVASNATSDLQRREADIAVRNYAPTEPELYAQKLPARGARFYATPGYLASIGVGPDAQAADLGRAEIFGFADLDRWMGYCVHLGMPVTRANFPLVTENLLVQWQLCRVGLGICVAMEEVGDADPLVRRVLPTVPAVAVPMYLVSHRELRTSRRIRVTFDVLAVELGGGQARAI